MKVMTKTRWLTFIDSHSVSI